MRCSKSSPEFLSLLRLTLVKSWLWMRPTGLVGCRSRSWLGSVDMIVQEYLSEDTPLVETSKNMTRELRHTGILIIISTQGEYFFFQLGSKHLSVRRTNLCSFRIARSLRYRYYAQVSSLPWWGRVTKHFSGNLPVGNTQAFDRLVNLQTGEAIIIAPSAFTASVSLLNASPLLASLRCRYFIARTRDRVTKDDGASILVL